MELKLSDIMDTFRIQAQTLPVWSFYAGREQQLAPGGTRYCPNPLGVILLEFEAHICTTKPIGSNRIVRLRYPNDGTGDFHRHTYLELVYVYKGRWHIQTDTEMLTLREKEFLLIDPNLWHRDHFGSFDDSGCEQGSVVLCCMTREFIDSVFFSHLEELQGNRLSAFVVNALHNSNRKAGYLRLQVGEDTEIIEDCLALLIDEISKRRIGYTYILKAYMLRILNILASAKQHTAELDDKILFRWNLYNQIVAYMEDNLSNVTLADLTNEFHFQQDYFNRLIHQFGECSYIDLLKKMRLQQAEKLLVQTDLSIREIMEKVGYQNAGYFYRLFQTVHQMSPSMYRKKARKNMS